MNNLQSNNDELDFIEIARLIASKIVWILLVTVLFAAIGFVLNAFLITPRYEASINLYVNTKNDSQNNITSDYINSAVKLVDTYAVIIKSNTVIDQIIDELDLDYTFEELDENITVSSINSTPVMSVVVNDTDPELAKKIVMKISEIAPPTLDAAVEGGSCKVVSSVYSTGDPVSPNTFMNTLIFAVLGMVLSVGFVVVNALLDNTFKTELDVQNELDVPILGVLPAIESCMRENTAKNLKRG